MKTREKHTVCFRFNKAVDSKTDKYQRRSKRLKNGDLEEESWPNKIFWLFRISILISKDWNKIWSALWKMHEKTFYVCHTAQYLLQWSKIKSTRVSSKAEKSRPEGKEIMPETRFISYPASSVDSRVWISQYASKTDDWLLFILSIIVVFITIFLLFTLIFTINVVWRLNPNGHSGCFETVRKWLL